MPKKTLVFIIILFSGLLLIRAPVVAGADSESPWQPGDELYAFIAESMDRTIETVGDRFPVATENGVWETDRGGWTGGYWAGMCWLMYRKTGEGRWLQQARRYTDLLARHQGDVNNIDVGILFYPSFILGHKLTGDSGYRDIALEGARTMMKRYNRSAGFFQNWGRFGESEQAGFVIIDCLINLDTVFWASEVSGEESLAEAAASHARQTMNAHVRQDGSCTQVVEFDQRTGKMLLAQMKQGYSVSGTWSRGQSWGIYGFSRAYRNSGDEAFLAVARRMADYYISNLPSDRVPYWDFEAPNIPNEPRDTSAGSMAASGLIELAGHLKGTAVGERYLDEAREMLASLAENYLTRDLPGRNDGVLTGGTYFFEIGRGVDQANIWGDYYFLEALLRLEVVD
jgi:unsaturated chondroitin disaccharide hydrolase